MPSASAEIPEGTALAQKRIGGRVIQVFEQSRAPVYHALVPFVNPFEPLYQHVARPEDFLGLHGFSLAFWTNVSSAEPGCMPAYPFRIGPTPPIESTAFPACWTSP